MLDAELLQTPNLRIFLELYMKKYSMLKNNFIANAYARDIMNISSEELRGKKKSEELKNLLNFLTLEFKILLQKRKDLKKSGKTYLVLKK